MTIFNVCNPDFSIICIWPHMPIDFGFGPDNIGLDPKRGEERYPTFGVDNEGNYNGPLGHAGILLIQAESGFTRYFEWGRYTEGGSVNTYSIPNAILDSRGWPTKDSLHNIVRFITRHSGRNTWMHGNIDHHCGGFDKAVNYAQEYQGAYNAVFNNCMIFAHRVNRAGGFSWFGPLPVYNSSPWLEMETGVLSNHIIYFPDRDYFEESVWQIR